MRCICRNINAIFFLVALPLLAFQALADTASYPLSLLDGLRDRIRENESSVDDTLSKLEDFFVNNTNCKSS